MKCCAALPRLFLIHIGKMLLYASLPRCLPALLPAVCLRSSPCSCLHSSLTAAMPGLRSLLAWTLAWLSEHLHDPSTSLPLCIAYLPKHFAWWVLPAGCPHRQGVTRGTRRWAASLIFQLGPAAWQQAVVLQLLMAGFVRLQPQAVQGPAQCPSSP